jgi:serine/threonine protein kinase
MKARPEGLMEPIQFGNYTLLERISHGGMAEVFRAKSFGEAGFEREVALKVLLPSVASDQEFVNMLIDEAKIAGQLNHANIAQIFDLGVADNRYYIVQEYVKGKDLRAILKHKLSKKASLDVSKACYIALKVCEGLYYAHNKEDAGGRPLNLVHRDISPHNILISDEGEVKIIDFGIAKAEGRATQTMAGLVKGKFAYMSPEQIRGLPVDHRSDIFATGILLHEMLTTRPLFSRSSEFETLKRARSAMADPPSQVNPKVPGALDTIVLKALARHVDDRYQTAQQFRDALWAFAREHNAFATDGNTAGGAMGSADGSDPSLEIEIGSEVRDIRLLDNKRGVRLQDTDVEDAEDDGYEITVEGSEATELAPQSMTSSPAAVVTNNGGGGGGGGDYDEDEENLTMVDPGLPFGVPGMVQNLEDEINEEQTSQEFTPTDNDAQWAASAMSPYGSTASPYATPAKPSNSPLGATLDDEATGHRDTRENLTSPGPAAAVHARGIPSDRRVTTPSIPAQRPHDNPNDPASTFQHASFDEQTVRKPGPKADEVPSWSSATPATNPKARKVREAPGQPALDATRAPTVAARGGAQSAAMGLGMVPGQPTSPSAGQAAVTAPPIQGAMGAPQFGMPPQAGHPGQNVSPAANQDLHFDEQTGSVPLHLPTPVPAASRMQSSVPRQPTLGHGVVAEPLAPSKRIYFLMSALFLLLLATAATITMVVTD